MHWLSLLAMIFVCFSRVGMCMNCDGSIPSYQSGNVIIDNTKRVQEAAAAKQTTFWHKVKDDIPGATYYKIIAVIPAISCSSKAQYWFQECFMTSGDFGCYLHDIWKDQFGDWRNLPFTVDENEIDLFGQESKWACLDQVPTVGGVMVPNCVSSSYSEKSKTNLQTCTNSLNLPGNWILAATPGVMTVIDDPYTPVTNLADCFYGMDENGDLYLTTWWKDNKPETEEERALFFKEDGDFKQMPRETFCECREVPNPVILSGKQHYRSEGLTTEQANENQLFRVFKSVVALCVEKECDEEGKRQECGECDATKEPDERCQITCAHCDDGEYADGRLCLPKSTCPSNSYAIESERKLNTLCKCNPEFYIDKTNDDAKFYENDQAFQAHEGTCKPCTTTVECNDGTNETKYAAAGCDGVRNAICVCNKGYEGDSEVPTNSPECTQCERGYYKDEIDQVFPKGTSNERKHESCKECPDKKMTYGDPGATNASQCECDISMILNGENCAPCHDVDPSKPYRAKGELACRDCDHRNVFDFENRICKTWSDSKMVIEIECLPTLKKWKLSRRYDTFVRTSTGSRETLDPAHEYWMQAYANVNATGWKITNLFRACASCPTGKYRIACGGAVQTKKEFGNEEYVIALKINGTRSLKTLNDQFASTEDYDIICPGDEESKSVDILREGMCMDCKECDSGDYADGCDANDAGSCKKCDVCETEDEILKDAKEYLYHPNQNQCEASSAQDCERTKCIKSKSKTDQGGRTRYKIGIECGEHDVEIWDPLTPKLANVEMDTKTIPGKGKFEGGVLKNYCPRGFYVDTSCFKKDEDWNSKCCILCNLHDALRKRSAGYRECPGDEDSDTQQYVERCENGFYEKTADGTDSESICEPCETCSFS